MKLCVSYSNCVADAKRFWANVTCGAEDQCWNWKKPYKRKPVFWLRGRNWIASRAAYLFTHHEIPDHLYVCHRCDNPGCMNPGHLFLGTLQDNYYDMVAKNRHQKGHDINTSKLTDVKVRELRDCYAQGFTNKSQLGRMFGISGTAVHYIIIGKNWRHLT